MSSAQKGSVPRTRSGSEITGEDGESRVGSLSDVESESGWRSLQAAVTTATAMHTRGIEQDGT